MNSAAYLSAVKEEIARLQQIQALVENDSAHAPSTSSTKASPGNRKGSMTQAGRARVAEAQRKRWAAKKVAAETAAMPTPAAAKKKTSAPVKTAAKTVAAVPPAKKQTASVSEPAVGKTAAPAKKVTVKKSAVATRPAAAKKATAAEKRSAGQAAPKKQVQKVRKQPNLDARAEATEAKAPVVDAAPAVAEDSSSSE